MAFLMDFLMGFLIDFLMDFPSEWLLLLILFSNSDKSSLLLRRNNGTREFPALALLGWLFSFCSSSAQTAITLQRDEEMAGGVHFLPTATPAHLPPSPNRLFGAVRMWGKVRRLPGCGFFCLRSRTWISRPRCSQRQGQPVGGKAEVSCSWPCSSKSANAPT